MNGRTEVPSVCSSLPFPPLAAVDPSAIIYLIIVFFWAVARIMQQSKKQRERTRMPRTGDVEPQESPSAPEMNEDLKELLETLTGQKIEIPRPRPQAPPPPPPPPMAKPVRTAARHTRHQPARPRATPPLPLQPAGELRRAPSTSPAIVVKRHATAPIIEAIRPMPRSAVTIRPVRGITFQFAPSMRTSQLTPSDDLVRLRNHQALRQAVLNKLILDQPRAFTA